MKSLIIIAVFLVALASIFVVHAQAPFQPNDQQSVELQLAKLDRDKAQLLWIQKAQSLPEYKTYQDAAQVYKSTADKIRIENKWANSVQFNDAAGVFYDTAQPEKKP